MGFHWILAVLLTIADAEKIAPSDCLASPGFAFDGMVLMESDDVFGFADRTGADHFEYGDAETNRFRVGDTGSVRGRLVLDQHGDRHYVVTNAVRTGHRPVPAPVDVTAAGLADRALLFRQVRMTGTVVSVLDDDLDPRYGWLTLLTWDGYAHASFSHDRIDAKVFRNGIGAEMRLTGYVSKYSSLRRHLGVHLALDAEPEILRPPEPPHAVDIDRLYPQDGKYADPEVHGKLITLGGTLGEGVLLAKGHAVAIDVSALPEQRLAVESGSTVAVTGLCLAELDTSSGSALFPRFKRFTLVPRTANDVEVLSRPPWWTIRKLLVVTAILSAIIVVLLLRRRIERGRLMLRVDERTRLAVELHDSLSQTLTGIAMQIDSAGRAEETGVGVGRYLDTARQMLASCRRELQGCLWDLRSRTFEEKDMNDAVRRTLAPHVGATALHIRFNVPRAAISETMTHATLRIIRELVVNAIGRGRATRLRVAGELKDGLLRFAVSDNGTGFDPETALGPAQGHFGLQGIRERLRSFDDGRMEIDSAPGEGSRVIVSFRTDRRKK